MSVQVDLPNEQAAMDLVEMVNHYRLCTNWVEYNPERDSAQYVREIKRKRALADTLAELLS